MSMARGEGGALPVGRLADRIRLAERALRQVLGGAPGLAVQVQLIGRAQGGVAPRLTLTRLYRCAEAELCVGYEASVQLSFPVVVDSTWVESFELRPLGARGGVHPFEGVFELDASSERPL